MGSVDSTNAMDSTQNYLASVQGPDPSREQFLHPRGQLKQLGPAVYCPKLHPQLVNGRTSLAKRVLLALKGRGSLFCEISLILLMIISVLVFPFIVSSARYPRMAKLAAKFSPFS